MGKLTDLDAMDAILDEHFSNDAGVKTGLKNHLNPNWHESQIQAGLNRNKNNLNWYEKYQEGNKKAIDSKHKTGTYVQWSEKMLAWRDSPEGKQCLEESRDYARSLGKNNSKQVSTPDGIFESAIEAAGFYNINAASMSQRMRDHGNLYYFTEQGPGKSKSVFLKITTPKGKFKNIPDAFRYYQSIKHKSVKNIGTAFYWFAHMQKQNPEGFYKNETA